MNMDQQPPNNGMPPSTDPVPPPPAYSAPPAYPTPPPYGGPGAPPPVYAPPPISPSPYRPPASPALSRPGQWQALTSLALGVAAAVMCAAILIVYISDLGYVGVSTFFIWLFQLGLPCGFAGLALGLIGKKRLSGAGQPSKPAFAGLLISVISLAGLLVLIAVIAVSFTGLSKTLTDAIANLANLADLGGGNPFGF